MKLAEALNERAAIQTRIAQLTQRAKDAVRVQEGEEPAEDPAQLIGEAQRLIETLAALVKAINATNSATAFDETRTITEAIADRDAARQSNVFFNALADHAAARQDRYTRSEIRFVAAYPVAELRERADAAAQRFRAIDTRLQELNWTTDMA